jgi:hypothetical protein
VISILDSPYPPPDNVSQISAATSLAPLEFWTQAMTAGGGERGTYERYGEVV